jgi:hypothetical protein
MAAKVKLEGVAALAEFGRATGKAVLRRTAFRPIPLSDFYAAMAHAAMTIDERSLYRDVAEYERRWKDDGDFRAVMSAFDLCARVDPQPFPGWLVSAVFGSLLFTFHEGGSPGKGKTGGHKTRDRRKAKDRIQWGVARFWLAARDELSVQLGRKATRQDAFEEARRRLADTFARGSAESIEATYNRVERSRKRVHNSG